MIGLDYRDSALFYPPVGLSDYGQDILGDPVTVPCLYVQTTGYQHSASQDITSASPQLVLPANDTFLQDRAYRLEGLVVEVNPFGGPASAQRFKVTSVTPVRDVLLDNALQHVVCELEAADVEVGAVS